MCSLLYHHLSTLHLNASNKINTHFLKLPFETEKPTFSVSDGKLQWWESNDLSRTAEKICGASRKALTPTLVPSQQHPNSFQLKKKINFQIHVCEHKCTHAVGAELEVLLTFLYPKDWCHISHERCSLLHSSLVAATNPNNFSGMLWNNYTWISK